MSYRPSHGRNGGNRHAQADESCTSARVRLIALLNGCTDTMLFAHTVQSLAATHRLHGDHVRNAREIETLLLAQQDKRRRQMAG